jgi:hypothetical protein
MSRNGTTPCPPGPSPVDGISGTKCPAIRQILPAPFGPTTSVKRVFRKRNLARIFRSSGVLRRSRSQTSAHAPLPQHRASTTNTSSAMKRVTGILEIARPGLERSAGQVDGERFHRDRGGGVRRGPAPPVVSSRASCPDASPAERGIDFTWPQDTIPPVMRIASSSTGNDFRRAPVTPWSDEAHP